MADVVVSGSADMLTVGSRKFYERARLKTFLSIVYAAAAMFFLALTCEAGGNSSASTEKSQTAVATNAADDYFELALLAQASGFGFATFCFFVAFLLALSAALIVSPFVPSCGNNNEARVLKVPQEV